MGGMVRPGVGTPGMVRPGIGNPRMVRPGFGSPGMMRPGMIRTPMGMRYRGPLRGGMIRGPNMMQTPPPNKKSLFQSSQKAKKEKDSESGADNKSVETPEKKQLLNSPKTLSTPVKSNSFLSGVDKMVSNMARGLKTPVKSDLYSTPTKLHSPAACAQDEMHEIKCRFCPRMFKSPNKVATRKCYWIHLEEHKKESMHLGKAGKRTSAGLENKLMDEQVSGTKTNSEQVPGMKTNIEGISSLITHVPATKENMCEYCDKDFVNKAELDKHEFKDHYTAFCEKNF